MSKCSHRMSPMNGGTRAKNPSFPRLHISLPRMQKLLKLTPSSENSLIAQSSQCLMSASLHSRGSAQPSVRCQARRQNSPLGMVRRSRSLSKLPKLAASACVIFNEVPGVSGGTWVGRSVAGNSRCSVSHVGSGLGSWRMEQQVEVSSTREH